jgi:hypothetical protein
MHKSSKETMCSFHQGDTHIIIITNWYIVVHDKVIELKKKKN